MIVPFAAGGTVDIVARIVGAKLAEIAGATVIVDNHGGAGGVIGTETVAQSPGDGYTLLLHSARDHLRSVAARQAALRHHEGPRAGRDDRHDAQPAGGQAVIAGALRGGPDRMAREKPNTITYATGGYGSSSHLAVALFGNLSGTSFNHVPYKGAGPALADVVAGHIDFTVATMPGAIGQVRGGAARARHLEPHALARAARRADHRGDRPARLRIRRLVRRVRAGHDAARAGGAPQRAVARGAAMRPTRTTSCASRVSSRSSRPSSSARR